MVRGVHVISFLDSTTNITWNCYDQNLPFGRLRPPCDIDINVAQFYKKKQQMYRYAQREIYVPQFSELIQTYFQCLHIINDQPSLPSGRQHRFVCYCC